MAAEEIERDPALALALALEAASRRPDAETDGLVRAASDACHEVAILAAHSSAVLTVDFSPDGDRLVTSSADRSAVLWNLKSEPRRGKTLPHKKPLTVARFSPDGKRVLTAAEDGTAALWNAATGEFLAMLSGHTGAIRSAAFDSKGEQILTSSADRTARVWNAVTGKPIALLGPHEDEVSDATFVLGEECVATASADGTARIWNIQSASERSRLVGLSGPILCVSAIEGGRVISAASALSGAALFDAATGKLRRQLGRFADGPICFRISSDGSIAFLAAGAARPRLVRTDTAAEMPELEGALGEVIDASFDPRATQVAAAYRDGSVRIFDTATGKLAATLRGHRGPAYSVRFNPAGGTIATASDDESARIWCIESGAERRTIRGVTELVRSLTFAGDDAIVRAISENHRATFLNRSTRKAVGQAPVEPDRLLGAWKSPDRRFTLEPQMTGTVNIVDAVDPSATRTLLGHGGLVRSASYSWKSDKIVTASDDQTAIIWDAQSCKRLVTLAGHQGWVLDAQFSPNGEFVATASADGTAAIWRSDDGTLLARLRGHTRAVTTVGFNGSSSLVATASEDQTVRVWPIDAAAESRSLAPRKVSEFDRERLGLLDFEIVALRDLLRKGDIETAAHAARRIHSDRRETDFEMRASVLMTELLKPSSRSGVSPAVLVAFARELVNLDGRRNPWFLTILAKSLDVAGSATESMQVEQAAIERCGDNKQLARDSVLYPLLIHRLAVVRGLMDTKRFEEGIRVARAYLDRKVMNPVYAADLYDSARRLIENEGTATGAAQLATILAQAAVTNTEPESSSGVEYRRLLAQCQLEAGQVEKAITSQLDAIAASKSNPRVQRRLDAWLDPLRRAGWSVPAAKGTSPQSAPAK